MLSAVYSTLYSTVTWSVQILRGGRKGVVMGGSSGAWECWLCVGHIACQSLISLPPPPCLPTLGPFLLFPTFSVTGISCEDRHCVPMFYCLTVTPISVLTLLVIIHIIHCFHVPLSDGNTNVSPNVTGQNSHYQLSPCFIVTLSTVPMFHCRTIHCPHVSLSDSNTNISPTVTGNNSQSHYPLLPCLTVTLSAAPMFHCLTVTPVPVLLLLVIIYIIHCPHVSVTFTVLYQYQSYCHWS